LTSARSPPTGDNAWSTRANTTLNYYACYGRAASWEFSSVSPFQRDPAPSCSRNRQSTQITSLISVLSTFLVFTHFVHLTVKIHHSLLSVFFSLSFSFSLVFFHACILRYFVLIYFCDQFAMWLKLCKWKLQTHTMWYVIPNSWNVSLSVVYDNHISQVTDFFVTEPENDIPQWTSTQVKWGDTTKVSSSKHTAFYGLCFINITSDIYITYSYGWCISIQHLIYNIIYKVPLLRVDKCTQTL